MNKYVLTEQEFRTALTKLRKTWTTRANVYHTLTQGQITAAKINLYIEDTESFECNMSLNDGKFVCRYGFRRGERLYRIPSDSDFKFMRQEMMTAFKPYVKSVKDKYAKESGSNHLTSFDPMILSTNGL